MLNALYPKIDWKNIKCVGFDLDGTLYDEYNFIEQAYISLVKSCKNYFNDAPLDHILNYMLNRWLEKGSSYNKIFDETYDLYGCKSIQKDKFIEDALRSFRGFDPNLKLTKRTVRILSYIKSKYDIFLITDGNPVLQERKINALKLQTYFIKGQVVFTGNFDTSFHKPNSNALILLKIEYDQGQIVYFGDKLIDKLFATNSGFNFVKVYNMIEVS